MMKMKELLFFIMGQLIGGFVVATFMCCLQINKYEKDIEENTYEN